jgi:hypothetical protein
MIRSYSELSRFDTFEERYAYVLLQGDVGKATFGFDRHINQMFYASREWKHIRHFVVARDNGCDLGVPGFEIYDRLLVHHMNPLTSEILIYGDEASLDPENLITTTLLTHNAIHFGNESFRPRAIVERRRGDTKLW